MFVINPGSEPVENASLALAETNIKHFVDQLTAALPATAVVTDTDVARVADNDGDGRFGFTLTLRLASDAQVAFEVDMPGVPFERVAEEPRWPWPPRLYVNGSSWWWRFAIEIAVGKIEEAV